MVGVGLVGIFVRGIGVFEVWCVFDLVFLWIGGVGEIVWV